MGVPIPAPFRESCHLRSSEAQPRSGSPAVSCRGASDPSPPSGAQPGLHSLRMDQFRACLPLHPGGQGIPLVEPRKLEGRRRVRFCSSRAVAPGRGSMMGPLVPGPRTEITSVGFCISIEGGAFGTLVHLEHQGLPGIPSWASGSGGCGDTGWEAFAQ